MDFSTFAPDIIQFDKNDIGYPKSVLFNDKGQVLVVDSKRRSISLFKGDGRYVFGLGQGTLKKPTAATFNYHPDQPFYGARLVVVDQGDQAFKVFDSNFQLQKTVRYDANYFRPNCITYDPTKKRYLVTDDIGNVVGLDEESFKQKAVCGNSLEHPFGIAVLPNGKICISAQNNTVFEYDEDADYLVTLFKGRDGCPPSQLAVDDLGNLFLNHDGSVVMLNPKTRVSLELRTLRGNTGMAAGPGGAVVVAEPSTKTVTLFSNIYKELVLEKSGSQRTSTKNPPDSTAFATDGVTGCVAVSSGGNIFVSLFMSPTIIKFTERKQHERSFASKRNGDVAGLSTISRGGEQPGDLLLALYSDGMVCEFDEDGTLFRRIELSKAALSFDAIRVGDSIQMCFTESTPGTLIHLLDYQDSENVVRSTREAGLRFAPKTIRFLAEDCVVTTSASFDECAIVFLTGNRDPIYLKHYLPGFDCLFVGRHQLIFTGSGRRVSVFSNKGKWLRDIFFSQSCSSVCVDHHGRVIVSQPSGFVVCNNDIYHDLKEKGLLESDVTQEPERKRKKVVDNSIDEYDSTPDFEVGDDPLDDSGSEEENGDDDSGEEEEGGWSDSFPEAQTRDDFQSGHAGRSESPQTMMFSGGEEESSDSESETEDERLPVNKIVEDSGLETEDEQESHYPKWGENLVYWSGEESESTTDEETLVPTQMAETLQAKGPTVRDELIVDLGRLSLQK